MANSLRFSCKGRVGFIDWLDVAIGPHITVCVERACFKETVLRPIDVAINGYSDGFSSCPILMSNGFSEEIIAKSQK